MKIANNKEVESERSDFPILSRHHCPEVSYVWPFQIFLTYLQMHVLYKYIKCTFKIICFELLLLKN